EEVLADPIGLNSRLGTYTNFANLLDMCGLAVPASMRPDGTPFGVTLLAPAGEEAALAAIGREFHRATNLPLRPPKHPPPPPPPAGAPPPPGPPRGRRRGPRSPPNFRLPLRARIPPARRSGANCARRARAWSSARRRRRPTASTRSPERDRRSPASCASRM